MTSISLYGAYDQADADHPAPRFGHPKDRRPELKQIQSGLAVTSDGGVPVFHRAYDGGAAEIAQVVGAMTELQKMARPREFLLIGDSKLVSYNNVSAMIASGTGFAAPASKAYTPAATLAALDLDAATDGWCALLTNLSADVDSAEILRRYGTVKGPLAVAPMFLKNNRRITALITVICLALLIFCLIERQVRLAIAPQTTLDGLYVGRPAKPTGRLIFEALARLRLIPATGGQPPGIPQPPPLQARLLDLLGADPTRPR